MLKLPITAVRQPWDAAVVPGPAGRCLREMLENDLALTANKKIEIIFIGTVADFTIHQGSMVSPQYNFYLRQDIAAYSGDPAGAGVLVTHRAQPDYFRLEVIKDTFKIVANVMIVENQID